MTTYPFGTSTGDREFTEADEQGERQAEWREIGRIEADYCAVGCDLYINRLSGREQCPRCKRRDAGYSSIANQSRADGIDLLWRIAEQELRRDVEAAEFIDHLTVEGEVMEELSIPVDRLVSGDLRSS